MKILNHQLWKLLKPYSFAKKGYAYFRVYGDGVLQSIKLDREHVTGERVLRIGLNSMYGFLLKSWFTSFDCNARYDVPLFKNIEGGKPRKNGDSYPIEEQFLLLENQVIPFLNEIKTQEQLAEAICFLDGREYGEPYPLNFDIIGAYLACKKYHLAERILGNIFQQNLSAIQSSDLEEAKRTWTRPWSKEQYLAVLPYLNSLRRSIYSPLIDIICNKDDIALKKHLNSCYEQNMKNASFCFRGRQGTVPGGQAGDGSATD